MDPIKTFISRPIFTLMLVMTLVVFGVFSYPKIGVDQMPEVEFPIVTVTTVLPGADPETIERNVTEPLEEALNTLAGLDTFRSVNVENVSQIIVRFASIVNVNVAAQDVRDRVQATLSKLPREIQTPVVEKFDIGAAPIATLALSGPLPDRAADEARRGRGEAVVAADRRASARSSCSAAASARSPSSSIAEGAARLRARRHRRDAGDPRAEPRRPRRSDAEPGIERSVKLAAEANSRSRSCARRRRQPEWERRSACATWRTSSTGPPRRAASRASAAGAPSALVVRKQSGANTVEVADAIKESLERIRQRLPAGQPRDGRRRMRSSSAQSIHAVQEDLIVGGVPRGCRSCCSSSATGGRRWSPPSRCRRRSSARSRRCRRSTSPSTSSRCWR